MQFLFFMGKTRSCIFQYEMQDILKNLGLNYVAAYGSLIGLALV